MSEVGTLKELDVKPGDVVYMHDAHDQYTVDENPHKTPGEVKATTGFHYDWRMATIISRATPSPKLWRDMTDAEKGALLLAKHEGKEVQWCPDGYWTNAWAVQDPYAYRIRPEPKVDVVTMYAASNMKGFGPTRGVKSAYQITFNTIDGKPDCASIKMEAI